MLYAQIPTSGHRIRDSYDNEIKYFSVTRRIASKERFELGLFELTPRFDGLIFKPDPSVSFRLSRSNMTNSPHLSASHGDSGGCKVNLDSATDSTLPFENETGKYFPADHNSARSR